MFWSPRRIEYSSRIVEARTNDGTFLRAKITVVFHQPCSQREADDAVARYGDMLAEVLEAHDPGVRLSERGLSVQLMSRPDVKRNLRRLDITGLHEVGSGIRPITPRGVR